MPVIMKPGRLFEALADIGAMVVTVLYIMYISLLLAFGIGTPWLNYSMLALTIAYVIFFIVKVSVLNRVFIRKKIHRLVRVIIKYLKYLMKLINAAFVFFTLFAYTSGELSGTNIIAFIGVFIVCISLLVSILWDIGWWLARRRLREFQSGWNDLSTKEKNRRVEVLISGIMKNVDSITGLDITSNVSRLSRHASELNGKALLDSPKRKDKTKIAADFSEMVEDY